jgi:hypothetical protein
LAQRWQKRGLLLDAAPPLSWARSHAALPCTDPAPGGAIDLYFSPRDGEGRAHVAAARLDASAQDGTLSILELRDDPVLAPGEPGSSDESGVTVSCVVRRQERTFLYYTGWTLGRTVPFYLYAGLAIRDGERRGFERFSLAPLLERNEVDPFLTASPWVLVEDSGLWRMWYVSGCGWRLHDGKPQHRYHIRYAESHDGAHWQREGHVCIDFRDENEYAFSRPCVVRDTDRYRMWFSARGEQYLIGYAESHDGLNWERMDEQAALDTSPDGWDSEMIAYPAVLDRDNRRYLLYNGNGYGASGLGYAILA